MPSISGISEKESYKGMIKELFQYWKQLHLGLVVLKINLILFLVYSNHFCFLEIIVLANIILVTVLQVVFPNFKFINIGFAGPTGLPT